MKQENRVDEVQGKQVSSDEIFEKNEEERLKDLVSLIAKIIVNKVIKDAVEKGYTVSEVQS